MKPLFLDWNLGLGDAIICNGLVRHLAEAEVPYRVREIIVPCWEHNLPTVRHMFSDLSNVRVVVAEGDGPTISGAYEVRSIGINYHGPIGADPNDRQWDEMFYRRAGAPFEAKWSKFSVPRSDSELYPEMVADYALCHDDSLRGFSMRKGVTDLPVVRVEPRTSRLTDWGNYIHMAAEIHCIDSSFMHLAELMPTTGKLFYHKYARAKGNPNHVDAVFRKPWVVLE
jgi:hypothetical protein